MNSNNHDIFQLIWKSTYSASKSTVNVLLKELSDEIKYQSMVVLPHASITQKKAVLKDISTLRKQRDTLLLKYDDGRFPRASGGLGGDPQETDENYKDEDASDQAEKSIKKSITKRELFKALFGRVWGSTDGINPGKLEKMSEAELDEQISALEKIFDNNY